jgi:AraC family transcriptional regulator of adaptative response/methylated-DNA-[protein]-cysteine methyltransferase
VGGSAKQCRPFYFACGTLLSFRFESKERIGLCDLRPYLRFNKAKERNMRDIIRFAWGNSSLGEFMVAVSEKGLVAAEFSTARPLMEATLRSRFPDAVVSCEQAELANTLEKITRAIEEPGFEPAIPLDMRGTAYELQVWSMLRGLPIGETISYGALSAKLGSRDARDATKAIASNPIAVLVPCHRVIKKDGSISGYRWGVKRKRELLARERRAKSLQR